MGVLHHDLCLFIILKASTPRTYRRLGVTTKWKQSGPPGSYGRCPTRNIHVSRQWYAWKTSFYLKKTMRFEGVFIRAASVSLTSILSYWWPMFTDRENQILKERWKEGEPIWAAGGGGVLGKVCSPAGERHTAVVWRNTPVILLYCSIRWNKCRHIGPEDLTITSVSYIWGNWGLVFKKKKSCPVRDPGSDEWGFQLSWCMVFCLTC